MDVSAYAALARQVELFRGLTIEDIAKIFAHGMTIRVHKSETIFYKGTVGSQMYVVLGGKLAVMDGDKVLAQLRTGDTFGEMALINSEPRSASVVAVEDAHLFVLSETTFQRLLTKRVAIQILLNIVRTLSHRLREANARAIQ
ncbi:MAG: cyclic nucleotide-binding domain-containing protein [Candidatus Hydrogenedentes bacterium]|nr:cyclic nucleotide-binding domain-containing protein [Candidatus Hydrogenedentota bacterium]